MAGLPFAGGYVAVPAQISLAGAFVLRTCRMGPNALDLPTVCILGGIGCARPPSRSARRRRYQRLCQDGSGEGTLRPSTACSVCRPRWL